MTDSLTDPTMSVDGKVAIVGIGCRFADSINSVYRFWDVLDKGMDCTTSIPPEPSDEVSYVSPGEKCPWKKYKCAGYLKKDQEYLDREFFKISPEEANKMDPQVRILLEVVWESLQDAEIPAQSVRGSTIGVYMGMAASEFSLLIGVPTDVVILYTKNSGNSHMVSNRISYEYNFRGLSLTVNKACSSSLDAILLAWKALRKGECDMAVAGGTSIFSQGDDDAQEGKGKTFDDSARCRGEGVGAVVLRPLKRAIEDGDRVYAVIRGGTFSNDGRTSGIGQSSYEAQIALLKKACGDAKVNPEDVAFLDLHGTGTSAGDASGANAIGEALGFIRRSDQTPLFLGSLKTNFGHADAAAGVAGVIKAALSLQNKKISKQVQFSKGNENVDLSPLNLCVSTEITKWPSGAKQLIGCSSFGFDGANAHIVLEGFEPRNRQTQLFNGKVTEKPSVLFLSAASRDALAQYLQKWEAFMAEVIRDDEILYKNALYTAGVRSSHLDHRVGIIIRSPSDARNQIRLKLQQDVKAATTVIEGQAGDTSIPVRRLVFVYPGMGSQWRGMARRLMAEEPKFRSVIQNIDKILTRCGATWSLVHLLTDEDDQEKINQTDVAQPSLFAVQVGLTEYYRSRGICPDAIVGQSVGEVAAAHAAGHLTLDDAVRLIYIRGRELNKTYGIGTMVAILHDVEDIETRLKNSRYDSEIDIAAVNSPTEIVLAGGYKALDEFTANLREQGIKCKMLNVNNGFHSFQQEEIRESLLSKLEFLKFSEEKHTTNMTPNVPLVSTVTSNYSDFREVNSAMYWWMNVRQPVKFMTAIQKLLQDGFNFFLQIGPHPVLSPVIQEVATTSTVCTNDVVVTGSLQRPSDTNILSDDVFNLLRSVSRLHVEGFQIGHDKLFQEGPYEVVSLPTYPWKHTM
ncbi:spectinabilin polyketide synthase system protein NorA-like [Diadema antillarum]|uniref:spectinabilin polyketide synthase system protein NorA-like n=1 Tax=Diadema antillarum TaxID=105358 RepID=UPI003A8C10B0